jgi:hypothetical protein
MTPGVIRVGSFTEHLLLESASTIAGWKEAAVLVNTDCESCGNVKKWVTDCGAISANQAP